MEKTAVGKWEKIIKAGLIILVGAAALVAIFFLFHFLGGYLLYAFFLDKAYLVFGLDLALARLLAIAAAVLAFLAIPWLLSLVFLRRKIWQLALVVVISTAICSAALYYGTADVFFDRSGHEIKPVQYYLKTLDGFKFSSSPDLDARLGARYKPVTPEVIKEYYLWKKTGELGVIPEMKEGEYFDRFTGEPIVWYLERSGGEIYFSSLPGYDTKTGQALKPMTSEMVATIEARKKAKLERQAAEEKARLEDKRQKEEEVKKASEREKRRAEDERARAAAAERREEYARKLAEERAKAAAAAERERDERAKRLVEEKARALAEREKEAYARKAAEEKSERERVERAAREQANERTQKELKKPSSPFSLMNGMEFSFDGLPENEKTINASRYLSTYQVRLLSVELLSNLNPRFNFSLVVWSNRSRRMELLGIGDGRTQLTDQDGRVYRLIPSYSSFPRASTPGAPVRFSLLFESLPYTTRMLNVMFAFGERFYLNKGPDCISMFIRDLELKQEFLSRRSVLIP